MAKFCPKMYNFATLITMGVHIKIKKQDNIKI